MAQHCRLSIARWWVRCLCLITMRRAFVGACEGLCDLLREKKHSLLKISPQGQKVQVRDAKIWLLSHKCSLLCMPSWMLFILLVKRRSRGERRRSNVWFTLEVEPSVPIGALDFIGSRDSLHQVYEKSASEVSAPAGRPWRTCWSASCLLSCPCRVQTSLLNRWSSWDFYGLLLLTLWGFESDSGFWCRDPFCCCLGVIIIKSFSNSIIGFRAFRHVTSRNSNAHKYSKR